MTDKIKIDTNYKEAFNLGYELAKELKLQSPMFKDSKVGNDRMKAMQAGMEQYSHEIHQEHKKEIGTRLDDNDNNGMNLSV